MTKINSHGHLLPYPSEIPYFMKERKLFWVDDQRRFMHQGDWKRPVTHPSFFLEEKLQWMEVNGIDHEVVITLSQLYCNGLDRDTSSDIIRFQNDYNAKVQSEYPNKFTGGFVIQSAYIDDALKEIDRCVNELDLHVLCLPTHFVTEEGQWKSTAEKEAWPIWEAANHFNLAVEIHPYDAPKMISLEDMYWRFHLIWMCAQTADHYHMYTLLGLHERYPSQRTCYAHGNQYGQINIGRRIQGYDGRPDLFENTKHPSQSIGASNIYFDTLVHDVDSLALLVKRHGASQVLAGLDDPYPLGEMETVPGCYPGKVIDEALNAKIITETQKNNIWNSNVLEWLGKEIIK